MEGILGQTPVSLELALEDGLLYNQSGSRGSPQDRPVLGSSPTFWESQGRQATADMVLTRSWIMG